MTEQTTLNNIIARIEELEEQNLTHTDEYEDLSDDWQTLSLDMVFDNIFGDDEDLG